MTIFFYVVGESTRFYWENAISVPRVGDYVKEGSFGAELKVVKVTWVDYDEVEILTER